MKNIFVQLIEKPNAPKFYRDLYKYYNEKKMENEAMEILNLIKIKFDQDLEKNDNKD